MEEFSQPSPIDDNLSDQNSTSLNLPHNDQVESLNRRELRKMAAESLIIQGKRMKKRARRSEGITELPIGTIVQVSVKDIDRVMPH